MKDLLLNPHRGGGLATIPDLPDPPVSGDIDAARRLFAMCPAAATTPLRDLQDLAAETGVASLHVKDERTRMGLGSFKALGAAYAIAKLAMAKARTMPATRSTASPSSARAPAITACRSPPVRGSSARRR